MIRTLFRLVMALRMGLLALLVAAVAWITVAPPTAQDARQLGLRSGSHTYESPTLMQMRFAKIMLAFAPERMIQKMAESSDGKLSETEINQALETVAEGPAPIRNTDAKFIRAPGN